MYLLKNNYSKATGEFQKGGYELINCYYQKGENDVEFTGSSYTQGALFTNSSPTTLTTDLFKWHTADGTAPFTIEAISLFDLKEVLINENYGAGITGSYLNLLLSDITAKAQAD